jgi:hypothetical protein
VLFDYSTSTRAEALLDYSIYLLEENRMRYLLLILAAISHRCSALVTKQRLPTAVHVTRKQCLEQTALVISSVFAAANPALAKDALEEDKQKLVAGYKRLNYLVENWEKEVRSSSSSS